MIVKFDKLFENKDELRNIDMKDPFYVAACAVNIMCAYDPNYVTGPYGRCSTYNTIFKTKY